MGARGRLHPFWTYLAVRLAAEEVAKIKIELELPAVRQGEDPVVPIDWNAAQEQFTAFLVEKKANDVS